MDTLNDLLNQLTNVGLNAKLVLATIILGYLAKSIPQIPNAVIPLITLAACISGNILLGDPGTVSPTISNPNIQLGFNGLIPWGIGWLLHNQGLSRLEKFLPAPLKGLLGVDETKPPTP